MNIYIPFIINAKTNYHFQHYSHFIPLPSKKILHDLKLSENYNIFYKTFVFIIITIKIESNFTENLLLIQNKR